MKSQSITGSYLRLFHALPTALSLDIYLDEKLYSKDLLYEDFTVYKSLTPGEHQITVCAHQNLEPLYTRNIRLSEHKIYTLALTYAPNTLDLQGYLLNDPHKPIPEEHLLIRTANFSQFILPMSLHLLDTKPIFKKIPLRQVGSYLAFIPTNDATLELFDQKSQEILTTISKVQFKITRYYTLYLVGGTEGYPLKWIQTIDGNSFLHFTE